MGGPSSGNISYRISLIVVCCWGLFGSFFGVLVMAFGVDSTIPLMKCLCMFYFMSRLVYYTKRPIRGCHYSTP